MQQNPHSICTLNDEKVCENCSIKGSLKCRPDSEYKKSFILGHLNFRTVAFLGLILIGMFTDIWWLTIVYAIGCILNFSLIEPRLLCSHCPFYAENGFVLHCNTLYGMPKFWKYRPGPISKPEKILMIISGAFVDIFPILAYIYGLVILVIVRASIAEYVAMFAIILSFVIQMFQFNKTLQGDLCHKCSNFSCAMNKVPKNIRNAYIKKNSVMKEAWEKAGINLDEE